MYWLTVFVDCAIVNEEKSNLSKILSFPFRFTSSTSTSMIAANKKRQITFREKFANDFVLLSIAANKQLISSIIFSLNKQRNETLSVTPARIREIAS